MRKNNALVVGGLLLVLLAVVPTLALAQPFPPGVPAIRPGNVICGEFTGVANRIISCIRNNIIFATEWFLLPFSIAFNHVVRIMLTLAVIFFGVNILFIRQQRLTSEAFVLAIKFGAVVIFTWNFAGLFPVILAIVDFLVAAAGEFIVLSTTVSVTVGGAPVTVSLNFSCPFSFGIWERVDCVLDRLIGGILPGSALPFGFLGFLFGCIFSGPTGFGLFLVGIAFVIMIIMAILKAAYIYLSALIGLALLTMITPLIIPLILFRVTKGYFDKWLRMYIALILQPVFLFAYLAMLLAACDVVIFNGPRSLYATIAGPAVAPCVPGPGIRCLRIGQYMILAGAYAERSDLMDAGFNLNPREMAQALGAAGLQNTGMWGRLGNWSNDLNDKYKSMLRKNIGSNAVVLTVDLPRLGRLRGMTETQYVVRVAMSLLLAAVVVYIFYAMMETVPYLGNALTSEVMAIPDLGKMFGKEVKGLQGSLAGAGGKDLGIKEIKPPPVDIRPRP